VSAVTYVIFSYDQEGEPVFHLNSGTSPYYSKARMMSNRKMATNYAAKLPEGHVLELTVPGQGDPEGQPSARFIL
jgi:hypothetical protein